jgi:murein DD-endopeptidase MepM/ murein hydrolase activator NlpD
MKKSVLFLIVVALSAVLTSQAMSATYTVRNNDTLAKISTLTGQSISELTAMNEIADPDLIQVGQQITYLSPSDLQSAQLWCEFWGPIKGASDESYFIGEDQVTDKDEAEFFRYAADKLQSRDIRYSIDTPHGLHYDLVLHFARAWNEL